MQPPAQSIALTNVVSAHSEQTSLPVLAHRCARSPNSAISASPHASQSSVCLTPRCALAASANDSCCGELIDRLPQPDVHPRRTVALQYTQLAQRSVARRRELARTIGTRAHRHTEAFSAKEVVAVGSPLACTAHNSTRIVQPPSTRAAGVSTKFARAATHFFTQTVGTILPLTLIGSFSSAAVNSFKVPAFSIISCTLSSTSASSSSS